MAAEGDWVVKSTLEVDGSTIATWVGDTFYGSDLGPEKWSRA